MKALLIAGLVLFGLVIPAAAGGHHWDWGRVLRGEGEVLNDFARAYISQEWLQTANARGWSSNQALNAAVVQCARWAGLAAYAWDTPDGSARVEWQGPPDAVLPFTGCLASRGITRAP